MFSGREILGTMEVAEGVITVNSSANESAGVTLEFQAEAFVTAEATVSVQDFRESNGTSMNDELVVQTSADAVFEVCDSESDNCFFESQHSQMLASVSALRNGNVGIEANLAFTSFGEGIGEGTGSITVEATLAVGGVQGKGVPIALEVAFEELNVRSVEWVRVEWRMEVQDVQTGRVIGVLDDATRGLDLEAQAGGLLALTLTLDGVAHSSFEGRASADVLFTVTTDSAGRQFDFDRDGDVDLSDVYEVPG